MPCADAPGSIASTGNRFFLAMPVLLHLLRTDLFPSQKSSLQCCGARCAGRCCIGREPDRVPRSRGRTPSNAPSPPSSAELSLPFRSQPPANRVPLSAQPPPKILPSWDPRDVVTHLIHQPPDAGRFHLSFIITKIVAHHHAPSLARNPIASCPRHNYGVLSECTYLRIALGRIPAALRGRHVRHRHGLMLYHSCRGKPR